MAGPEYRQAFVQADDLLLVQPEQGAVEQLTRIADPASEDEISVDCRQELAQRCLDQ